ncbi:MAG: pirin family protein [Bacteroidia bacterium]|nr:pirin family protein [Bacteroidia bacterium]
MTTKLDLAMKHGNRHISMLYPGQPLGLGDSGIGSIGRIDQADIQGGTTIRMHPHRNDEILSYFRTGKVVHTDSAGTTEIISRNKLMLMKAGRVFYHEEKILDRLEGLQIFIRPMTADYEPEVLFEELDPEDSPDRWRLLASDRPSSHLRFTSRTEIFDASLSSGTTLAFPETELPQAMYILYAFQGSLLVNGSIALSKGESILTDDAGLSFSASSRAEAVLFITDPGQACFKQGMFSGRIH